MRDSYVPPIWKGRPPTLDEASLEVLSWMTACCRWYRLFKDTLRDKDPFDEIEIPFTEFMAELRWSFNWAVRVIEDNLAIFEKYGVFETKVKIFKTPHHEKSHWSAHGLALELVEMFFMAVGLRTEVEYWEYAEDFSEASGSVVAIERYFLVRPAAIM